MKRLTYFDDHKKTTNIGFLKDRLSIKQWWHTALVPVIRRQRQAVLCEL